MATLNNFLNVLVNCESTSTDNAYVYAEEETELETFSPELTDAAGRFVPKKSTANLKKVSKLNISAIEITTKVSDFDTEKVNHSAYIVTNATERISSTQRRSDDTSTISTSTPIDDISITGNVTTETLSMLETSNMSGSETDLYTESARVEDLCNVTESSTLPSSVNQSDIPTISSNDTLELCYQDERDNPTTTTKRSPVYEVGYFDPKIAPTRYGQVEEHIMPTHWDYTPSFNIGIRDYNLILYAVNNTAVLEKGSLINYVYYVFKEILHVNLTMLDIRYCRYLRSKNQTAAKKTPPVLVAFAKMEVKNAILHKRKNLKPTGIKVEHDMPKKYLEEQNALLKPLMDKYRAMGQYVVVRSGKLLVEGKVLTQIDIPDKYTYEPLQTFASYVMTSVKTTVPGVQLPVKNFKNFGYDKPGKKKKKSGGQKKKRKPVIRITLDEEVGDELSANVLFPTRQIFW